MVSLPPLSRGLARATRQYADRQTDRIAPAVANAAPFYATVDSVTPQGGADGISSAVTVAWGGTQLIPANYGSTYTPTVGDRVACLSIRNQPFILDRAVG